MLDVRYVAEQLDEVRALLARRSPEDAALLDGVTELAQRRREVIQATEALQSQRNAASEAMAALAKSGDKAAMAARREELKKLSDETKRSDAELAVVEAELEQKLLVIPNVPHASTPDGKTDADNPVVRAWGEKPSFAFTPKGHTEIGEALGILDFDRAAKLSGARFAVLWGAGARLERALITFMLDLHTREHGYTEVYPPFLVKRAPSAAPGKLAEVRSRSLKTYRGDPKDDDALYLSPRPRSPSNLTHAEILDADQLPIGYAAYTPCFRSEAGSYGRDVKGLIRQHQFDKVEIVRFCAPEQGLAELERLTGHAEEVLRRLELHYRVVEHVAGDLTFSSTKSYDLEVWLPEQNAYREISSCSWFGDFQASRAKCGPPERKRSRASRTR